LHARDHKFQSSRIDGRLPVVPTVRKTLLAASGHAQAAQFELGELIATQIGQ
jgi:hypothetical protein